MGDSSKFYGLLTIPDLYYGVTYGSYNLQDLKIWRGRTVGAGSKSGPEHLENFKKS